MAMCNVCGACSMRSKFSCIIKSLKQLQFKTVERSAVTTDYQCDKSNGYWTLKIEQDFVYYNFGNWNWIGLVELRLVDNSIALDMETKDANAFNIYCSVSLDHGQ